MEEQEKILKVLLEAVHNMSTTLVPYPKMGNFSEKDIRVVRPTTGPYEGQDLIIHESYCVTPRCDCRRVHLDLIPASNTNNSVYFQLNFDTKEIDWPERMPVTEESKAVAEEFCRDAYENLKSDFRKHYHEAKQFGNKLCNLLNSCYSFETKAMVVYCDIFPGPELWSFSYGKETVIVVDQYCAQPECPCQDVMLTFYDAKKDAVKILFAVRLENGQFIKEESSTNPEEMKRLISTLELKVPHLQAELLSRLQKAKEFGRMMRKERIPKKRICTLLESLSSDPQDEAPQRPEPVVTEKKVGRNEPCPCGSGKKYKKCCGRR